MKSDSTMEQIFSDWQFRVISLAAKEENQKCADCKHATTEWASVNLGIFICIDCSGIHRSFGTHISKVRSVKLDKWDEESFQTLQKMGNTKANEYWEANIPSNLSALSPLSSLLDFYCYYFLPFFN